MCSPTKIGTDKPVLSQNSFTQSVTYCRRCNLAISESPTIHSQESTATLNYVKTHFNDLLFTSPGKVDVTYFYSTKRCQHQNIHSWREHRCENQNSTSCCETVWACFRSCFCSFLEICILDEIEESSEPSDTNGWPGLGLLGDIAPQNE